MCSAHPGLSGQAVSLEAMSRSPFLPVCLTQGFVWPSDPSRPHSVPSLAFGIPENVCMSSKDQVPVMRFSAHPFRFWHLLYVLEPHRQVATNRQTHPLTPRSRWPGRPRESVFPALTLHGHFGSPCLAVPLAGAPPGGTTAHSCEPITSVSP